MPRLQYDNSEAESNFNSSDVNKIPLPKPRPSSADAEFNNSIDGKIYREEQAAKVGTSSWLHKAIYGK